MKKLLAVMLSLICIMTLFPSCGDTAPQPPEEWKVLFIGNSFSADTSLHLADIALALGVQNVTVGNLYIGGCSINKHYDNAVNDYAVYEYHVDNGNGLSKTLRHRISDTVKSEEWDWIAIQHGTLDGSRYAEDESYEKLPALIDYIRSIASEKTQIAFNMTWVGERNSHEELIAYKNNQLKYYQAIASLTERLIVPMDDLAAVSPTGTAIQNARAADAGLLTRDKYHLTEDLGCYIAGLTFFKTVTGLDISSISWKPDGVTDEQRSLAIEAAANAVATPFAVTEPTE